MAQKKKAAAGKKKSAAKKETPKAAPKNVCVAVLDEKGVLSGFEERDADTPVTAGREVRVPMGCDLAPGRYRWDGERFVPIEPESVSTPELEPHALQAIAAGLWAIRGHRARVLGEFLTARELDAEKREEWPPEDEAAYQMEVDLQDRIEIKLPPVTREWLDWFSRSLDGVGPVKTSPDEGTFRMGGE